MHAFFLATFLVFIAEMGDKTQLVALAFATRYRAATVIAGVFLATFAIHLGSVALGEAAARVLPLKWIEIASGIAFLIFGFWTVRGDEEDEGAAAKESRFGPLMTVAVTFFLAELGDKTMLMTVTIASEQRAFVPVWLGSTVGMVLADGLAIIVGKVIGKQLPDKAIRYGAAVVFFASGLWTLYSALRH